MKRPGSAVLPLLACLLGCEHRPVEVPSCDLVRSWIGVQTDPAQYILCPEMDAPTTTVDDACNHPLSWVAYGGSELFHGCNSIDRVSNTSYPLPEECEPPELPEDSGVGELSVARALVACADYYNVED